jgi:hypothetical protein
MQKKSALAIRDMTMKNVDVRASVNRFLLSQVGSQFAAGEPALDVAEEQWQVPILMITPGLIVGQVGEAIVSQHTHEIICHTPAEQIYKAAGKLRKLHHAEIKAAFLRARRR